MTRQWRRILFGLGLTIGLALLLGQVWRSYEAFQRYGFKLLCPACLGAALALSVLLQFVQMLAWLQVMRHLGYSLPLARSLAGYMLSFLPRYIPGSVWGYLGRSEWLARSYGINYVFSIASSALEALALIIAGLWFAGLYLCIHLTGFLRLASAAGLVALLLGAVWLLPKAAIRMIRWRTSKAMLGSSEEQRAQPVVDRPSLAWFSAILLYLGLWSIYGAIVLLIGRGVAPFPAGGWLEAITSISLSWIAGFLALFVPTGIGVREFALSNLLARLTGVFVWQGVWIAVISRLITILGELIWVIVALLLYASERRRLRQQGEKAAETTK